jgi:hypothetical protein
MIRKTFSKQKDVLTTIFLLVTFTFPLFSQSNDLKERIWRITDSIIIERSSPDYLRNLVRDSIIWVITKADSIESLNSISNCPDKCKEYKVSYETRSKNGYILHTFYEGKGLGPAGIDIELESCLRLKFISNIEAEYKAFKRYNSAILISASEAKKVSAKYFTIGYKDPISSQLITYDLKNDEFIWRMRKYKGFMNVTLETVFIDAENSKFLNKETEKLRRYSIWKAIFRQSHI